MPTYTYIQGDGSTQPDLAYNEVVVTTEIFDISLMNPIHNVDLYYSLPQYNRVRITTKYIDMGMGERKPAHHYYGALSSPNYVPAYVPRKYVKYGKPDMGLSEQSRVGPSLTSKPKTRGKSYPIFSDHSGIFGRNGQILHNPCSPGYYPKMVNGRAMCVKR